MSERPDEQSNAHSDASSAHHQAADAAQHDTTERVDDDRDKDTIEPTVKDTDQGSDAPGHSDGHPKLSQPLPPRALVKRRAKWIVIGVGVVLLIGSARTLIVDVFNQKSVSATTKQNQKLYVSVVTPTSNPAGGPVTLPATLRGEVESPIYARANGYVLHWYTDIGAPVKQGQLLAVLETPEIDQELQQAVAQRQQYAAALSLAKTSAGRYTELREGDAVSQQELDDRTGTFQQSAANLAAADANVRRLEQLRSFKRITAPFAGVITQRNIDVGTLINAGNTGAGAAMFVLSQSDPLRVYVSVPQAYSAGIHIGQQATVRQSEYAGTPFKGTITHTSASIDVPTRSLQIEITLPNPDGKLLPGAYVQVELPPAPNGHLVIPENTLLFRAEGPSVAVVGADGRVKLHPVTIAQDTGQALEIERGISASDKVITNPSDSVDNGDVVSIASPSKPAPKTASNVSASGAKRAAGASGSGTQNASGASGSKNAKEAS